MWQLSVVGTDYNNLRDVENFVGRIRPDYMTQPCDGVKSDTRGLTDGKAAVGDVLEFSSVLHAIFQEWLRRHCQKAGPSW